MIFLTLLAQFVAATLATIGFASIFGVERRFFVFAGPIGGFGWILSYGLTNYLHMSATLVVFLSAVLVTLLSRFASVIRKCPVTIFLISGIISLVPGAQVYWTAYYLVVNDPHAAQSSGFAALKTAIALVIGIVVVLELPNTLFHPKAKKIRYN